MGLDMYLFAQKDLDNKDTDHIKQKYHIKQCKSALGGMQVRYMAMYWRKAYTIDQWFADKFDEGDADPPDITIMREDLEELLASCNRLIDSNFDSEVAEEVGLEPSNWYDGDNDWWREDITKTRDELAEVLEDKELYDFQYHRWY